MQTPADMFSGYRKERCFQLGSISKLEAAVRMDASHKTNACSCVIFTGQWHV